MPVKRTRTKACDRCETVADTLFRCRYTEAGDWRFICPKCLDSVRNGNPHYQYGGTWKSKKRH
ncbi:MAG: hypothetical protein AAF266_03550 [Planctomycetota bacterium]